MLLFANYEKIKWKFESSIFADIAMGEIIHYFQGVHRILGDFVTQWPLLQVANPISRSKIQDSVLQLIRSNFSNSKQRLYCRLEIGRLNFNDGTYVRIPM